ncbi:MAG: fibronectin type III domain-containing protein, partial [Nanoarchaeota archaeon]
MTISNVRVTKVSSNSATIEWSTDNISNGRVRYGQTTALGFTQRHDNFIGNHTVALFNGVDSDTEYFFAIESTDLAGTIAVDNNNNNFYTFKTTDITPPPQVTGLKSTSATSDSIFLSWNNLSIPDLRHYIVYKSRVPIDNAATNSFNDTGLSPNTDFSYKVSAVDNSGNEGPQSDTLITSTSAVDSTAPVIGNVGALPITDTTARITWLTNENSTTTVLYGVNKTDKTKSLSVLETNHSIVIEGLTKNVNYVFVARSCDASNNCANSSVQSFTAGRDIKVPFINLAIPRFVNRRVIDLLGSTEQFSSVTLFVNNMNLPKRSLSNNEIGASGKFTFSQVQLDQDNVIKVVMTDMSGNKNQKIFEVSIATEAPIVQLNDIPSLTSKTDLAISGSTNEPATINVFVDANVKEVTTPSKTAGLNTTKIGQNSVEIHWDESKDKDFSHYAVYRDNAAIALTKPANFNLFIDALVDSGRSYTYQVSAVNIFGNEGPKSEPIGVTTLNGGAILNLQHPEVDIFEDFRKPLLIVNVSSPFSFNIKLNKGDGTYLIKLIFEDRAGNSVVFERSVTLDTKKPEVKILSPPSGAFIFENVANEIDIIGKTKPNARVHLFVDRTPFSFNQSFETTTGIPPLPGNEIQDIPEGQLDAKCRSAVSVSFCRTGADVSVDADGEGNFKFENIDLAAGFVGATRLREVSPTDFRDIVLDPETQKSKTTTLVVIATDKTGQRGVATHAVRIGTCWSGNQSWDIIPLTQYQSPALLSTERFAEGTETAYFYFNYSYIGRGTSPIINGITISKACGTREVLDPRFNISCQVMPSGVPTQLLKTSINPTENRVSYSAMQLNRFPGMDRFLEDDWKSFFKAINNELT